MSLLNWRTWLFAVPLALLVGCTTVNSNEGTVQVTIRGQYEKQTLGPSGFGGITTMPIRHSYLEVYPANGGARIASYYLGSGGTAELYVAPGTQFYVAIYAEYEVPGPTETDFFQRGGVINQPFDTTAAFTVNDEWYVTSDNVTANTSGTLTVTATAASRIAGAFNINDQMLTQGLALKALEPSLRLPSLFTYWSTNSNPLHQQRNYPSLWLDRNRNMKILDGRAVFTQSLNGLQGGGPYTETDEWDDGVIQEVSAHMLFADYSLKADGSSGFSLLRRDNDNTYVSRYFQSESTVGFVGGFCDFLAGALRNNPVLLDSYLDNTGAQRVEPFDLRLHIEEQIPTPQRSEFTRGSVATTLWGIWKNSLPGDNAALTTLWQAVRSNAALSDGTGEFKFATLACYPSYLLGVKSRVSGAGWSSAVSQLALENIPEPTPAYFASNALWQTRASVPFAVTGSLQTYVPGLRIYYNRNQSQAYRFTQSFVGSRTITMTPTGGQDFWVEVIGPDGVWAYSPNIFDNTKTGQTQTFTAGPLPIGVYVVRVRAGNTNATGTFGYTLSVQ